MRVYDTENRIRFESIVALGEGDLQSVCSGASERNSRAINQRALRVCKRITKLCYLLELKMNTHKDYAFSMVLYQAERGPDVTLPLAAGREEDVLGDVLQFLSDRETSQCHMREELASSRKHYRR